jgi:3D (Asp-Asp-Asp) domain-containing protein
MASRSLNSQDPVQERRVDGEPSTGVEAPPAPMLGLGESRTFEATAYALHGVTRNGVYVRRGVIAADPRILPLGSIVQLTSDQYSGVYRVHDTGGLIKGEIIDLWVPTSQEARQFGRRKVKIQVLKLGKRRVRP